MPGDIQSVERAAAILRVLSGRTRRVGVVDLAGELGLPKGTVPGLLRTLQHVGFIEQDLESGKYQLGAALLHMGSSYLDGNELRTRALNSSDALAARTHEAVRIGTLHDSQVRIVHHVLRPDDSLQTLDVGSLLPAHATALGKVLLANRPYNHVSIAAPISDRRSVVVGAIAIFGTRERLLPARKLRADLLGYVWAARAVSRELGAIPW